MSRSETTPPGAWTRLLERLLPPRDRADLLAALEELYGERVVREGRAAADRWYRREVLDFLLRLSAEGITRRRRRWEGTMGEILNDIRRAGRSLLATPGSSAAAVATLALGIGATTLVYSVVDGVAIRPLDYPDAERLVAVWPESFLSRGEVDVLRREAATLERVGAWIETDGLNLEAGGEATRVAGSRVTPELLEILGVRPVEGRLFRPDESEPGRDDVVLLAHPLWVDRFGADPGVVGRDVRVDGVRRTVVGVLPPDHDFPSARDDLLLPIVMDRTRGGEFWGFGGYRAIGRMAPGVDLEAVRAEMPGLAETMRRSNLAWTPREDFRAGDRVVGLREAVVGEVRPLLLVLLAAVGLVLLVVCANVANLLLGRSFVRSRESAIRTVLGAGRGRLVRESLFEVGLLAAAGLALGTLAATVGLDLLRGFLPRDLPRVSGISIDQRVLVATSAVGLLAGLLAGILPALRSATVDPARALREGGRGGGGGRRRHRLSRLLVTGQVAVAVVLVISAGLLVRTLGALGSVEPGFAPEHLVTARLTPAGAAYAAPESRLELFRAVRERMEADPAVVAIGLASTIPFDGVAGWLALFIEGVTDDPNVLPSLRHAAVGPGYFEAMRIPVVEGRSFDASDDPAAPLVALVDQVAAERFWPGESPLGRRVRKPWRGAPWMRVVGVVGSVSDGSLAEEREPSIYTPLAQEAARSATFVVRHEGDVRPVISRLRDVVREAAPSVPLSRLTPYEVLVRGSTSRARLSALLFGLFGATTLLLGCVGVYGVAAYSVRERSREIGVRLALGASRRIVLGHVVLEAMWLAVPGVAVGLLLALPATGLLESFLYGVPAVDPVTFVTVPILMAVAALAAVYLPARRAMRVDPAVTLRDG